MNNKESEPVSILIPVELKNKLGELSNKKNISRNALIRLILTEYLEKQEQ